MCTHLTYLTLDNKSQIRLHSDRSSFDSNEENIDSNTTDPANKFNKGFRKYRLQNQITTEPKLTMQDLYPLAEKEDDPYDMCMVLKKENQAKEFKIQALEFKNQALESKVCNLETHVTIMSSELSDIKTKQAEQPTKSDMQSMFETFKNFMLAGTGNSNVSFQSRLQNQATMDTLPDK
jgi:hypothetical protein